MRWLIRPCRPPAIDPAFSPAASAPHWVSHMRPKVQASAERGRAGADGADGAAEAAEERAAAPAAAAPAPIGRRRTERRSSCGDAGTGLAPEVAGGLVSRAASTLGRSGAAGATGARTPGVH